MRLRILGCSGGISAGLRTTSFLLDDEILIDAGTGVGDLTLDEMRRVRHIFITHSHLDHVASIPKILDTLFTDIEDPIQVHAQPETIEALTTHIFNWTIWPDFAVLPNQHAPVMKYVPMSPGESVTIASNTLEMIPVNHIVPGVGYLVSRGEKSFCFSGDTTTNDSLWERLNQQKTLDLLLVECAFAERDHPIAELAKHYCPELLMTDLKKLKHRPRIVISHLQPGDEELIMQECEALNTGFDIAPLKGGDIFEI